MDLPRRGLLMLGGGRNRAIRFCGDGKDQICFNCPVVGWKLGFPQKTGTNFRKRFLRPKVFFADDKENAIHKSEGVIEHELFQLAIVGSAPEFALEKSPPDFYFTIL